MLKKVIGDRVNPISSETVEQTLENALECPDSTNQDETLIEEIKDSEMMVNPLITGLDISPPFLGFTHSQVAEFTGKKVSTISPYFSRARITKGNGHAFKPNKKTMLWDEIEP